jgi:hypothetical protein
MDLLDSLIHTAAHEVFGGDSGGGDTGGWGSAIGSIFGGDSGGGDSGGWGSAIGSFLGGGSDGGGDGEGGWGSALGSFLGGGSDGDDGGGDGGGWASAVGGFIDRYSGDGGRENLVTGLVDKVSSYLPEDIRGAAGQIFSGGSSSWSGNLVNTAIHELPSGWQSVANTALGHGYFSDNADPGSYGTEWPVSVAGQQLDQDPTPYGTPADPNGPGAVYDHQPGGSLGGVHFDHIVADPQPDAGGSLDGVHFDHIVADPQPDAGGPDVDDDVQPDELPGPGVPLPTDMPGPDGADDYDSMVTSGVAENGGLPDGGYDVPDDPTFPDDPPPAPEPVDVAPAPEPAPEPVDDFSQSIDAANQMGDSMTDDMFEGLE